MTSRTANHAALVHALPTPIAMPWARLDTTDDRLTQMTAVLATLEAIHRFLVALVLAEAASVGADTLPRAELERGTLGALREILNATTAVKQDGRRPLAALTGAWIADAATMLALRRASMIRNDYAHARIEPADHRLESMLRDLRNDVALLLRSLAWLHPLHVAVIERGDLQTDGSVRGRARHFCGAAVPSPLRSLHWRGDLPVGHAYLVDTLRQAALPLTPWAMPLSSVEPGLCSLGLVHRLTPGGVELATPLQAASKHPPGRPPEGGGGWRMVEFKVGLPVASVSASPIPAVTPMTTQASVAAVAPVASSSVPTPMPRRTALGTGAASRHALAEPCPSCGRPRHVLQAPFEAENRRFLRCDGCASVVLVKLPAPGTYANATSTLLWSQTVAPQAVLPGQAPVLVAVAGPLEGQTVTLPSMPQRLGVLGSAARPHAAVILARTVSGVCFAFKAFGDMRLARDGHEVDLLRVAVGDEIEVGRSRFRVVGLGATLA